MQYLSKEVQKKTGVPKSTLKNWVTVAAIKPVREGKGRGGRRKFSEKNMLEVMICRELWVLNMKPGFYREILDLVEERNSWARIKENPKTIFFLVISYPRSFNGKTEEITSVMPLAKLVPGDNPKEFGSYVSQHHTSTVINLSQIYQKSR